MIVRNWMQKNPITITGDTLVSEAKRLISENNLHVLPVVENGKLRGLITRASCLRAGLCVTNTQSADELRFFTNRLKVKDIMVRKPATIDAEDTMEHCLERGREIGVGQFPVLNNGEVVGIISANEVFSLAAHFLGAWEKRSGITLSPIEIRPGVIGSITDIVESQGSEVQAIYPIGSGKPSEYKGHQKKKIIVRFHSDDVKSVVTALEAAGYRVLESVQAINTGNPQQDSASGSYVSH